MYQRILVPIDGSETSNRGAAEALRIAKAFGSTVRFFHVIDLSPVLRASEGAVVQADGQPERVRLESARVVDAALAKASEVGVTAESGTAEIIAGRPAEEIHSRDRSGAPPRSGRHGHPRPSRLEPGDAWQRCGVRGAPGHGPGAAGSEAGCDGPGSARQIAHQPPHREQLGVVGFRNRHAAALIERDDNCGSGSPSSRDRAGRGCLRRRAIARSRRWGRCA